ncbi:hypothetical protein ACIRD3_32120 [Kitasatospora sp. NPDC093550]|uniref:hypothetical protein n=1 Tax=Kitasatospora sp. NPDC093550 TaxID=3364089 RepID=UPI0037FCF80D
MTQETGGARRLSARQKARLAAAERAERFERREAERRRLAEDVILSLGEAEEFAAETERLVADLRRERAAKLAAKSAAADALVVALLDTGADAAEAAERIGLSQAEVKAARRRHTAAEAASAASVRQSATEGAGPHAS